VGDGSPRAGPPVCAERKGRAINQWSVTYGVDLLKHALGPEALFDADLSVGRDLLAMLAFVVLAHSPPAGVSRRRRGSSLWRAPSPHRNGIYTT
jgi:hypothetical protein